MFKSQYVSDGGSNEILYYNSKDITPIFQNAYRKT